MQKKNRRPKKSVAPVAEKIPLVSVVIPMYNSAKFIAQTLESLLNQTMTDFEVVVVDDCSTDNSVEVVESFVDRLKRLHVIKLPKNSGAPGIPRNVGIQFARGKYIAFLDSDDLYTKTALEELSTLAEKHQADVLNMPAFFQTEDNGSNLDELLNPANHKIINCQGQNVSLPKEVLVVPNDIAERIKFWCSNKIHWATCGLFCRRDFLIINRVAFPNMFLSEDQPVQFSCLCFAEKILSIPNITYIVRRNVNSITRKNVSVEKYFHKWLSSLNTGFREFEKIMASMDFFGKRPDYRYAVLNWYFERVTLDSWNIFMTYSRVPAFNLNDIVKKEFHPDDAPLAAYLFNTVNIYRLQIMKLQQELNALKQSR